MGDNDKVMKEYRRPYSARFDYSYSDMMRSVPAKGIWNNFLERYPSLSEFWGRRLPTILERQLTEFLKQSERKKPYLDVGNYPAMEHEWEDYPGIRPRPLINPKFDFPWKPVENIPPDLGGGAAVFFIKSDDEWCPGSTVNVTLESTHPVYFIQLLGTSDPASTIGNFSGFGTNRASFDLTAGLAETGFVRIGASMTTFDGITGYSSINLERSNGSDCPFFLFSLVRGDGTVADGAILSGFSITGKNGGSPTFTTNYDASTNVWTLELTAGFDPDNLYWVDYTVSSPDINLTTQYPGRYKPADQGQSSDLIPPGDYSDVVPYYEVIRAWDLYPIPYGSLDHTRPVVSPAPDCIWVSTTPIFGDHDLLDIQPGIDVEWRSIIASSIPYKLRLFTDPAGPRDGAYFYWRVPPNNCNGTTGTAPPNGICAQGAISSRGPGCPPTGWGGPVVTQIAADGATITETASDGFPAGSYSPGAVGFTSAKINPIPAYDYTLDIAPNVSGNTHFFRYSATCDDAEFDCDENPVGFPPWNPPINCVTHQVTFSRWFLGDYVSPGGAANENMHIKSQVSLW